MFILFLIGVELFFLQKNCQYSRNSSSIIIVKIFVDICHFKVILFSRLYKVRNIVIKTFYHLYSTFCFKPCLATRILFEWMKFANVVFKANASRSRVLLLFVSYCFDQMLYACFVFIVYVSFVTMTASDEEIKEI